MGQVQGCWKNVCGGAETWTKTEQPEDKRIWAYNLNEFTTHFEDESIWINSSLLPRSSITTAEFTMIIDHGWPRSVTAQIREWGVNGCITPTYLAFQTSVTCDLTHLRPHSANITWRHICCILPVNVSKCISSSRGKNYLTYPINGNPFEPWRGAGIIVSHWYEVLSPSQETVITYNIVVMDCTTKENDVVSAASVVVPNVVRFQKHVGDLSGIRSGQVVPSLFQTIQSIG